MRSRWRALLCTMTLALALAQARPVSAENGADLWLRYRPLPDAVRTGYSNAIRTIVVPIQSPTGDAIAAELSRGLKGLLGRDVPRAERADAAGDVLVATLSSSPAVAALGWDAELRAAGEEGYVVRAATVSGHPAIVIASIGESGALYGTFRFLRALQTHEPIAALDLADRPKLARRLLNHWDNLDGTIERGYAGRSLFWPSPSESRIVDYARANASIGINGAVINSVNANPQMLTAPWLDKASAIARILRPYRIRVYLAANFAAPVMIGGLKTSDPLDPGVARWWRETADEIYQRIPDFGGFVVKANSEGQPGPQDYGRTHADGANVLADAIAGRGGVVMWRAFVYNATVDRDRVKRAYTEFVPLDGSFRGNVFAQVKNGPLDFQPREPFHPLFGAMPRTALMAELQITQEYLGQSTHAVYLAPMWSEFLNADTYAKGPGSFVSRIVDGSLEGKRETGMAGVANTGLDDNWTGHDLAQANWYAFGRLAWNPSLDAAAIADEWIRMTWSADPLAVATIRSILLDSREAYVHYTMPLGLHHLIGGDHYAPMPENTDPRRDDWSATTYHRADANGIGVDRTPRGNGAVSQYQPALRAQWSDPASTPDELLLWFHRLPWTYRMKSGRTLWEELVATYMRGAEEAKGLEARWIGLAGKIDDERYGAVRGRLGRQAADAAAWRDKCLRYFGAARAVRDPALGVAQDAATVPRARTDANSQLAHEALLRKKTQGKIDLYFLGDSIVRRWGALDYPALLENWRGNFSGWNAADFGWGADRVENMLWRLDNGELDGVNPKVIVILAGTNNIGREPGGDAKVADIAAGIKALVDRCRALAPRATIILTGVFPRNDSMAVMPEIAQLNATIARLANRRSIIFLDVNRRLADANGRLLPGMMNDDQLHPTIKGYQVWADALEPELTRLLGRRGTVDHAPPPTGDPSAIKRR
jgi:alpha-glucuronidase